MKRIFIYMKGIKHYDLWYKKDVYFKLRIYSNVDWVCNMDDRKITSG